MSDPQMQPRPMPTATLDVVQGGGSDPMCCPGDLATRRFGLHDGKLVESTPVVSGRLSAASVGAAGWRLVAWDTAEPLTDDVEVSIGFADGRFAGRSRCNRYGAAVTDGDTAGEVRLGPTMSTRMACEGPALAVEARYLKLLAGVNRVQFWNG